MRKRCDNAWRHCRLNLPNHMIDLDQRFSNCEESVEGEAWRERREAFLYVYMVDNIVAVEFAWDPKIAKSD